MGTVYLSFSRGGRPVAVKVVKQEFAIPHPQNWTIGAWIRARRHGCGTTRNRQDLASA
jgi:hypothetical protein